jgi:copper chaperone
MIELEVTGMTCQHCVRAVSDALSDVPGVTRVATVDLDAGRAAVEGDPDPQELIAAVQEAGYEARLRGG